MDKENLLPKIKVTTASERSYSPIAKSPKGYIYNYGEFFIPDKDYTPNKICSSCCKCTLL